MSDFRGHLERSLEDPEFKTEWEAQATEREALGAFMVARNRELSKLDRLPRKPVLKNPLDNGLSSIWGMYDERILLSLENLRRHVASLRAWRSVYAAGIDETLFDSMLRDYVLPLAHDTIDLPQSINNMINHACLRLNWLSDGHSEDFSRLEERATELSRNGREFYKEVKRIAVKGEEWQQLENSLQHLHKSPEAKRLQALHGGKYHNTIPPVFAKLARPRQDEFAPGTFAAGCDYETVDLDRLLADAEKQLARAHDAYLKFSAYAESLVRADIKRMGGVVIEGEDGPDKKTAE